MPVTFQFEYAATSSPASVGENNDTRQLALGFKRLTITSSVTGRTLCDIDFAARGNSADYVLSGFGVTEEWGTWSIGKKSVIVLRHEFEPPGPLQLAFDAKPYAGAFKAVPFTVTSSVGHRQECLLAGPKLTVRLDAEFKAACTVGSIPRKIFKDRELQRGFARSGYARVPMLSPTEVSRMRARLATLKPDDNFAPNDRSGFERRYHCSFLDTNVGYRREAHRLIREFFDPYVARYLNGYHILNSNFYVKPPGTGEFEIHQNWPALADLNDTSVTIWCPLVEVDETNGAIQIVAGSHKILPHVQGPSSPVYFKDFCGELIDKYLKVIAMSAGEALIFDDSLIHWSAKNNSDEARIAIQIVCVPSDAQPVHFFFDRDKPDVFEVIAIDEDFYLTTRLPELMTRQPHWQSLGFSKNRNSYPTERQFAALLDKGDAIRSGAIDAIRDARIPVQALDTTDVKNYYDEKTAAYIEGFGDVFQGNRPESTEYLLKYIIDAANIADGMRILDAGCGVCGPAVWFAQHRNVTVEALTISPVQVREAKQLVSARGLTDRINVREGDFHDLVDLYPAESFDRVLFLETLCHARDYRRVIEHAKRVLKPGGYLYIKDYYTQDFRSTPELLEAQREDLKKLNSVYHLVMPDLASTVDLILELGFRLKYVREPSYVPVYDLWKKFELAAGVAWNPTLSLELISGLEIFCSKPEATAGSTETLKTSVEASVSGLG
jgi:SAM-dependent methyltransferase